MVLKHGGPTPVPVLPAADASNGSQLAENSPEVQKLIKARQAFYKRINLLKAAGLPTAEAMGLLQQRTGGDFVFLARTCGIPAADATKLDHELVAELKTL